ncbi:phytoene desaturase family protein [Senegalia massiliensis]|uniref:phytoene desaturase family protein n=1 Tax=Senegalia massiliensis TaxID=1720316 RepID=UPI001030DC8B|nr:phytoene desaturase family protein [Senegalia massiliensis]
MKNKVIIIGAGPGGLSAGMILATKGYDVEIFEKQSFLGGRTSTFNIEDYKFDLGPTFLMMKDVLEDLFNKTGRKVKDYIDIKEVDPLYRIVYGDGKEFYPSRKPEKMISEIERLFPGNVEGYKRFMNKEKKKYDILFDALKESYIRPVDLLKKEALKAIPYIGIGKSLFDVLGKYFNEDDLKMAFTFQAKYLGMSPWECPGGYSIISYIEHVTGVHHIMGGFGEITKAMAKVIEEEGGQIHLNSSVKKLLIENKKVIGVELDNGKKHFSNNTVINSDFGYSMNNLIEDNYKKKYNKEKINRKQYSCSTYMLYLGIDKVYNIPHNNIIFSSDYKNNVYEIGNSKILSEDPSIYVQNAVVTDKSVAPKGKSTIYILVPVPNNTSNIDWEKEKYEFRDKVLNILETRGGFTDLRKHIEVERMITPKNWEEEMNVYKGAVFNLGHNISQMLYFRPHNKFEELDDCYLVGGGTHPGSGLPTIFESGIITSKLLEENNKNKISNMQRASIL